MQIALDNTSRKNIIIILFISTLVFYGFSLPFSLFSTPHFSPNNDFSNHAHLMYRFAESFKLGQIIPRTVVGPMMFSDATAMTSDIPTFQYYGSFEGFAALPFHLLGLSDAMAAVLSSILIRFLGLLVLFKTCRLFECSRLTALLACFSLLISPYTLTVFYGRGALAETFAQSLLVLIPYAYALAYRGDKRRAILACAAAFFLLALCHNIFFVYGFLLCTILALFSLRLPIFFSMMFGALLGCLMSAWQWMPAQETLKDITLIKDIPMWGFGHVGVGFDTASLSGAIGFPQRFTPPGVDYSLPLYFTVGWWTLPFILLAFNSLFQKERKLILPYLISAIVFIMLTFPPFNRFIYMHYAPTILGVVQDTVRLLGFVSLLGSLCFAIAIPKISLRWFQCLLVLMMISQIPVFNCYIHLVSQQNWENKYVRNAPINYYYSDPSFYFNTAFFSLRKNYGIFEERNKLYIPPGKYHRFFLHLVGLVIQPNAFVKLNIIALDKNTETDSFEETSLISKSVSIHSDFSTMLEMPANSPTGWYKVTATPINSKKDQTISPINLYQIDLIPDDLTNYILADNIERLGNTYGYSRKFQVKKIERVKYKPDSEGYYTLELPMAYSQLFSVTQARKPLEASPDYNHRLLVRTNDISKPIYVKYKLGNDVIALSVFGILGFIVLIFKKNLKKFISPRIN